MRRLLSPYSLRKRWSDLLLVRSISHRSWLSYIRSPSKYFTPEASLFISTDMIPSNRSIRPMMRCIHSSNKSLPTASIIRLLSCHQVVMLELLQCLRITADNFPPHTFLQIRQPVPALASCHHIGDCFVLAHPLQCPRADFQQVRRLLARQQDFRFFLRHVVFLENIVRYPVYLLHHRFHDLIVHCYYFHIIPYWLRCKGAQLPEGAIHSISIVGNDFPYFSSIIPVFPAYGHKKAAPPGIKTRMKPPDKIISSNLHITIFLYL